MRAISREHETTAIRGWVAAFAVSLPDQGPIDAPTVIAATGPWTRPLFQKVGYDLPIETEFHQVAILKNSPDMKGGGCACIDSGTQTYFRPDGRNKFLVGDFYGKRPR